MQDMNRNCSEVDKQYGCHHQGPQDNRQKHIIQNLAEINVLFLCWLICKTQTTTNKLGTKNQTKGWITATATGSVAQYLGFNGKMCSHVTDVDKYCMSLINMLF